MLIGRQLLLKASDIAKVKLMQHFIIKTPFLKALQREGLLDEQAIFVTDFGITKKEADTVTILFEVSADATQEQQNHLNTVVAVRFNILTGTFDVLGDDFLDDKNLNGGARGITVADFNSDGLDDFAFALSQDGRIFDTWEVQPQVYLSNVETRSYDLTSFGEPQFTHNVPSFVSDEGHTILVLDNVNSTEAAGGYYSFVGDEIKNLYIERPVFDGSDVKDESYFHSGGKIFSFGHFDVFAENRSVEESLIGLAIHELNGDHFILKDTYQDMTLAGGYMYNYKLDGNFYFPGIERDGEFLRNSGYNNLVTKEIGGVVYGLAKNAQTTLSETGFTHENADGEIVPLYKDEQTFHNFELFKLDSQSIVSVPISADSGQIEVSQNVNFYDLFDINEDNIPDIVVYIINKLPIIFLSEDEENYRKVEVRDFLDLGGTEKKFDEHQLKTRLKDIDEDGSLDLIYTFGDSHLSALALEEVGIIFDIPLSETEKLLFTLNPTIDFTGSNESEILEGGVGNDILNGNGGDDIINGGTGDDTIDGGDGNDTLSGGQGNDTVKGNAGNDTLDGGAGNDTIVVGGSQTFSASYNAVNISSLDQVGTGEKENLSGMLIIEDIIDGGAGTDTIELGEGNIALFLHDAFSGFHSSSQLNSDSFGEQSKARLENIEKITGNDSDVNIIDLTSPDYTLAGQSITVDGAGGRDIIWGSDADEIIIGGDGNDELFGGAGTNVLTGGAGADEFQFTMTSTNDSVTDFNAAEGDTLAFYNTGGATFDRDSVTANSASDGISIEYSYNDQTLSLDISLGLSSSSVTNDLLSAIEII